MPWLSAAPVCRCVPERKSSPHVRFPEPHQAASGRRGKEGNCPGGMSEASGPGRLARWKREAGHGVAPRDGQPARSGVQISRQAVATVISGIPCLPKGRRADRGSRGRGRERIRGRFAGRRRADRVPLTQIAHANRPRKSRHTGRYRPRYRSRARRPTCDGPKFPDMPGAACHHSPLELVDGVDARE